MLHICTATAALIHVLELYQCLAEQRIMPVVKLQFMELRVQKQVMNLLLCCPSVFVPQLCMYGYSQAQY